MAEMDEHATGEPQRTHPLGLLVNALRGASNAIVPIIAIAFGGDNWGLTGGLAGLAMLGVVALVGLGSFLKWYRLTYTINAEDIRVESGVLSRQARSVPYERIQDVSLEQKLLARVFGLAEVKFETGAGGGEDIALAWLTVAEGERMRELVRDRRDAEAVAAPAGAVSAENMPDGAMDAPIFTMSPARIATFGMFEFSLVVLAVLVGVAQQYDFLIPWDRLPFDGLDDMLEDRGRRAFAAADWAFALTSLVTGLGGLILLGIATGIVRTMVREWGFRLDRTPKGFRRRRGLTTLTDVVLPAHRVQAAIVGSGWIRRMFGWHGLKFVSLAQDTSGSSSHAVAPFAKLSEIWPIAQEAQIMPPAQDLEWQRPNIWRWLSESVLLGAVLGLVALGLSISGVGFAWMPLALVGVAVLMAAGNALAWSWHRHAIDEAQVYTRTGWFKPRLTIAPRMKLQTAEITSGPFGRLFGYCDIHFGLAGGSFAITGALPEEAETIRAAVVDTIAAVDFSDLPQ